MVARREELFERSDIVTQVRTYGANADAGRSDLELLRPDQIVVGLADPLDEVRSVETVAERGVTLFALELIPRITRAQSMDVLSSQATIVGYKAVLLAAARLPKLFPMLTTAAGTLAPARVLIVGAGVAGLQAIATARRLGALVEAYDVRPAAREEIESLGAQVRRAPAATGRRGRCRRPREGARARRSTGGSRHCWPTSSPGGDVVVSSAAIPGERPPVLVSAAAVDRMAPGCVIVDLTAERGGNCALSRADEVVVTDNRVAVLGPTNLAATVPLHASEMFAKNVVGVRRRDPARGRAQSSTWTTRSSPARSSAGMVRSFTRRSASVSRRGGRRDVDRLQTGLVRLRPGDVPRVRADPARPEAAPHAADGADQRDIGRVAGGFAGDRRHGTRPVYATVLGTIAVTASTINVVGGFMITDRMLRMFRRRAASTNDPTGDGALARQPTSEPAPRSERAQRALFASGAAAYVAAAALFVVVLRWAGSGDDAVTRVFTTAAYLLAAAAFILALRWLTDPRTARRGVVVGEVGMLLAVVGTLVGAEIVSFVWIAIGMLIGSIIGTAMALFMPMTAMPQRIALSHAFGALAAALVGTAHYYLTASPPSAQFTQAALGLEVLLGFLTFTGSLMAFGKLQGAVARPADRLSGPERREHRRAGRGGRDRGRADHRTRVRRRCSRSCRRWRWCSASC